MKLSARSFMERLARNRYFKRELPIEFGGIQIYVSPDSQLKYLKPGKEGFDTALLDLVSDCISSGSIVWDIGANVGVFAFASAGRGAVVTAIEPDPWLAELLRRSAREARNRTLDIKIISAAISNRDGCAELWIAQRGRASNTLASAGGNSMMGGVRDTLWVPTLTLDTLLDQFGRPDFVKIDVEGAEQLVLEGGGRLLGIARPIIAVEVNDANACDVTLALHDANYRLYDADCPRASRKELSTCAFNTLAIPTELASSLQS